MDADVIVSQLRELHVLGADGPMKEAADLIEQELRISRIMYRNAEAFHDMAELLWEELQLYHLPDCFPPAHMPCFCHSALRRKWDELVGLPDSPEFDVDGDGNKS